MYVFNMVMWVELVFQGDFLFRGDLLIILREDIKY